MMKPSIPKGTRDFSPIEMARRNYIFSTIRDVYNLYGFSQIETPSLENLSTLMGKYGEEGDRLLFKILDSGDVLGKVDREVLTQMSSSQFASKACEKGLRYDLTVPFARYVVMHRNELTFPFKRYQIQPVWRADRPQKGRYREFYQCDGDIIGSTSLLNEVELLLIIDEVYARLGIKTRVLINNRKILSGIAETIGAKDKLVEITVAIDKMEKIGIEKVRLELQDKGLTEEQIQRLEPFLTLSGNNEERLSAIQSMLAASQEGLKGVEELSYVLNKIGDIQYRASLKVDFSLARGLSYYTGAIFEVKAIDSSIGSITGGGRYDNLTGIFGLADVSGVGISFGADRIYDVLTELDLWPESACEQTQVLMVNFGDEFAPTLLNLSAQLRSKGIRTEIYPDSAKMKKQLGYANDHQIPFVILIGEDEMKNHMANLKNMQSGQQEMIAMSELVDHLIDSLVK